MGAFATGAKVARLAGRPRERRSRRSSPVPWAATCSSGLGLLHGSRIFSYEQLLLDAEIYSIVRSTLRGHPDRRRRALRSRRSRAVGPGGDYLTQPHTRRHMRERWQARYMDRRPYSAWEAEPEFARTQARRPSARAPRAPRAGRPRPRPVRGAATASSPAVGAEPVEHPSGSPSPEPGGPMRPTFQLLGPDLVERVIEEALALLGAPGVKVQAPAVLQPARDAGATVEGDRARIPARLVQRCPGDAPRSFDLFDRQGRPAVRYGQGRSTSTPGRPASGSWTPRPLEPRTSESARPDPPRPGRRGAAPVRRPVHGDRLPRRAGRDRRPVPPVPGPAALGSKPVVTGAFRIPTLERDDRPAGDRRRWRRRARRRPRAVFDVCSSPPLTWAELGGQNLHRPRAGARPGRAHLDAAGRAAAPVTLIGCVVQHAAETLSGIVIHQLAEPGAPIVWGGAPAILDMRSGRDGDGRRSRPR